MSEDILPDSRWESETVTVESNGKPDFTWDLDTLYCQCISIVQRVVLNWKHQFFKS